MRLHRIAPGYYQTPDELYRIVRECEEGERFWTIYAHEGKRGYPAGNGQAGNRGQKWACPL